MLHFCFSHMLSCLIMTYPITVRLLSLMVLLSTSPATGATPAGASGLSCPSEGTTLSYDDGGKRVFHSPDAADPFVCRSTTGKGVDQRQLFNVYGLGPSDVDPARQPLQRFFAGEKEVSFTMNLRTGWQGGPGLLLFRDTWTHVGEELLTINGITYQAQVMEWDRLSASGAGYHHKWRFWMSKDRLLLLKGEYNLLSGSPFGNPHSWKVIAVSQPS
jgi:hypothetical protein